MKPQIFDTHAHYDDRAYDGDRHELLTALAENGVELILNAGVNETSTNASLALAERYDFVYAAAGYHPEDADRMPTDWGEKLRGYVSHPKCLAIGEIGLDYHYGKENLQAQKNCFRLQMEVAAATGKPVVIHQRDALADTMEILKEYRGRVTGVLHCFSGSWETAKEVLHLGYYLGLGGTLTFQNARHAPEVAAKAPLDRLLLETDAPYLTPAPFRGTRNRSDLLCHVAKRLGDLQGMSQEEICRVTMENGKRLFSL